MAKLKCPKCKSPNVQVVSGKTKTTVNLNPLKPFTIVNHSPKGKQKIQCMSCGNVFEKKL